MKQAMEAQRTPDEIDLEHRRNMPNASIHASIVTANGPIPSVTYNYPFGWGSLSVRNALVPITNMLQVVKRSRWYPL
ncbi:MAG: hypothetical protein NVS9B11_23760 [Candidatus Dormibacteraceae bacterium]